jgi:hypothetical protein
MKTLSMSLDEYKSDLQKEFLAGYRKSLLDLTQLINDAKSLSSLRQELMDEFHVDAGLHVFQVEKLIAAVERGKTLNEE